MDPASLAGDAVALLAPFLGRLTRKVSEDAVDQVSDATLSKLSQLYAAVKAKLVPGTYAGNQLAGVEERPDRVPRQKALADALAEVIEEDPRFAEEVQRLVQGVRGTPNMAIEVGPVGGSVAIGGGGVRVTGDYAAGGSITIHQSDDDTARRGHTDDP